MTRSVIFFWSFAKLIYFIVKLRKLIGAILNKLSSSLSKKLNMKKNKDTNILIIKFRK